MNNLNIHELTMYLNIVNPSHEIVLSVILLTKLNRVKSELDKKVLIELKLELNQFLSSRPKMDSA